MALSYYGKRAVKWLLISLALFALTIIVREVAWTQMVGGGAFAVAFTLLVALSTLATLTLGAAVFFAMLAV